MRKFILTIVFIIPIMWVFHTFSKNFMVDPTFEKFLARKDDILTNESLWLLMIRMHIFLAIISLLTGPIGVLKKIRRTSIQVHRWNGRIYVISILLNFIPGIYVSFFATGGWISAVGFLILNSLWLYTTVLAYWNIKRKKVSLHSTWMTRSFFLTFANMTIYIVVLILHTIMNIPYSLSYTIAVWSCWILNLLLAEIFIRKRIFL